MFQGFPRPQIRSVTCSMDSDFRSGWTHGYSVLQRWPRRRKLQEESGRLHVGFPPFAPRHQGGLFLPLAMRSSNTCAMFCPVRPAWDAESTLFIRSLSLRHHDLPQLPKFQIPRRKQGSGAPGERDKLPLRERFKGRVARCQPRANLVRRPFKHSSLRPASCFLHTWRVIHQGKRAEVTGQKVIRVGKAEEGQSGWKEKREREEKGGQGKKTEKGKREGRKKRKSSHGRANLASASGHLTLWHHCSMPFLPKAHLTPHFLRCPVAHAYFSFPLFIYISVPSVLLPHCNLAALIRTEEKDEGQKVQQWGH